MKIDTNFAFWTQLVLFQLWIFDDKFHRLFLSDSEFQSIFSSTPNLKNNSILLKYSYKFVLFERIMLKIFWIFDKLSILYWLNFINIILTKYYQYYIDSPDLLLSFDFGIRFVHFRVVSLAHTIHNRCRLIVFDLEK